MSEPTTPTAIGQPPDPYFYVGFARRITQCVGILDRTKGFVEALGDVIGQAAADYDHRLTSRLYLVSHAADEILAVSAELSSLQVTFLAWRRAEEEHRRRELARLMREARRRERRRMRRRGKK